MLNKESHKATKQIFRILQLSESSIGAKKIQPAILRFFTSIYLQGRKDQADKVAFERGPEGIITFLDK